MWRACSKDTYKMLRERATWYISAQIKNNINLDRI
jgi:hypothetical protein